MKKKGLIITICVLVVLIIMSLITKYIDTANVSTGHEPECCIKIVSQDGGKVTYWGLGYKVVRYVGVSPKEPYENNIGVKMGSWFMNYENPTNVILDVKSFGDSKTFKVSDKADVDFVTNLLKHSKYIDESCDGIVDYAITYDNDIFQDATLIEVLLAHPYLLKIYEWLLRTLWGYAFLHISHSHQAMYRHRA